MANEGIELLVYRHDSPKVIAETLEGRLSPQFLADVDGGGGSVQIPRNLDKVLEDPTLLDYRNIFKIKVNGTVVGAFQLVTKTIVVVGDGEKAQEVWSLSGKGVKVWFEDAELRPKGGIKSTSRDKRYFTFAGEMGIWYKPNDWHGPVVLDAISQAGMGWPADWPQVAVTAQWVWAQAYTGYTAPMGYTYYRHEFTTSTVGNYTGYILADDAFDVYFDGELVASSDPNATASGETKKIEINDLPIGSHVIAIRAFNARPNALAGLRFALTKVVNENLETLITRTGGAGWVSLAYPAKAPGWSAGEILITLLNEAQARGVLFPTWLTRTFSATVDSDGNPWGDNLDWTLDIGTPYSDILAKFEELACKVWIDPANYYLYARAQRGIDRSIFRYDTDGISVPVEFRIGKNLMHAEMTGVGKIKNSLSIKTEEGWLEANTFHADSVGVYGAIEGTLNTGASIEVSKALAQLVFNQKATAEEGATYDFVVTDDTIPFVHFTEGDWVLAPNENGVMVKRQVMSISVTESASGQVLYAIEFDTIFQSNEARLNDILNKTGGGGLGGGFSNAGGNSPPQGPLIITPTSPPVKIPKMPTGMEATSIGQWDSKGMTAFSEVTLTWLPVTQNTDSSQAYIEYYEVWAHLTASSDDAYAQVALVTTNQAIIRPYEPNKEYTFKLRARSAQSISAFSIEFKYTPNPPFEPPLAPDTPVVTSSNGLVDVLWNGLLGGAPPKPQFRYVYARVSQTVGGVYTQIGTTLARDGRNINIPGLVKGLTYWVQLIAVDGVGIQSAPSTPVSVEVLGIEMADLDPAIQAAIDEAIAKGEAALATADGKNTIHISALEPTPEIPKVNGDQWWVLGEGIDDGKIIGVRIWNGVIWNNYAFVADSILVPGSVGNVIIADGAISTPKIAAGAVQADTIGAGAIQTRHLSSGIGQELDISSNESVNIIVGHIDDVEGNLEEMQTYYKFGATGAEITSPSSPYTLGLMNDRIEMRENGNVVSYWNSGQMYVSQFVGEKVILGNHQLEKYSTGTVVRAL